MNVRVLIAAALCALCGCGSSSATQVGNASTGTTGGGTTGGTSSSTSGTSGSSGTPPMGVVVNAQGGAQLFDTGATVSFSEDINTGTQYLSVSALSAPMADGGFLAFHLYAVLPQDQMSPYQLTFTGTETQGSQITFDVDAGVTDTCSAYTLQLQRASSIMGVAHAQASFNGDVDDGGGAFTGTINL